MLRATTITASPDGLVAGLVVKKTAEVPAVLAQAKEIARAGRPVLVNVWLDRTDFAKGHCRCSAPRPRGPQRSAPHHDHFARRSSVIAP